MKKLLTLLLLTSGLISVFAQEKIDKSANSNQEFDIVILNGRVMDPETLFDDVANVGIKDGRIATITKQLIKGQETIDAALLMASLRPWIWNTVPRGLVSGMITWQNGVRK
jgi:hypothetical protein